MSGNTSPFHRMALWVHGDTFMGCTGTHLHLISKQMFRTHEIRNSVWFLSRFIYLLVYVSLTMHLSIILANDQLDAQIFNTFITVLYMHMFRAISCSSSGGQVVLIQHLVSSLSVSDRPVHRLRKNCVAVPSQPAHRTVTY